MFSPLVGVTMFVFTCPKLARMPQLLVLQPGILLLYTSGDGCQPDLGVGLCLSPIRGMMLVHRRVREENMRDLYKDQQVFDRLLATTPVGSTFEWNDKVRLVHMMDCGRRYTTVLSDQRPVNEAA